MPKTTFQEAVLAQIVGDVTVPYTPQPESPVSVSTSHSHERTSRYSTPIPSHQSDQVVSSISPHSHANEVEKSYSPNHPTPMTLTSTLQILGTQTPSTVELGRDPVRGVRQGDTLEGGILLGNVLRRERM